MALNISRRGVPLQADVPSTDKALDVPLLSRIGCSSDAMQQSGVVDAQDISGASHSHEETEDVHGTEKARLDKVAAVRKALAEDTYHVAPTDIAARLIEQMLGK